MSANDSSKDLSERLNSILKQLDGLTVHEVKVMLCNAEREINYGGVVKLDDERKAVFDGDLRPPR